MLFRSVLAVSRSGKYDQLADEVFPAGKLNEVLAQAELIVLALPQNSETKNIIGAAELAVCRKDAVLINVSRGGLIDPEALRTALENKTIAAAGLDVTEPEPLPTGHPLWKCPNLLITPHIAGGGSKLSRKRLVNVVAENLALYRAGKPLLNQIRL